ncbi:MAG: heme-degrading domain-containing protein [Lachnospiraceae bacterium]|jgi:uncharacterized protein (UPF0303 family)|nr:heme-degrading domain-containing protein [Lachnospiraceae bacterium]
MDGYEQKYNLIDIQEKQLRFERFDNEDAWQLGCILANEAKRRGVSVAVDIVLNGYQVFRYGGQGTNNYNEIWLSRKIQSVNTMHVSTLKLYYMMRTGKEDIYQGGNLDPASYAAVGGGFPIYVNGTGCVGAVAVSGLTHHEDHDFAVDGLCKYLDRQVERVDECAFDPDQP